MACSYWAMRTCSSTSCAALNPRSESILGITGSSARGPPWLPPTEATRWAAALDSAKAFDKVYSRFRDWSLIANSFAPSTLNPADHLNLREDAFTEIDAWDPAGVTVRVPDVAQDLFLLSIAASEPMGSYAQMGWYDVWSPCKP